MTKENHYTEALGSVDVPLKLEKVTAYKQFTIEQMSTKVCAQCGMCNIGGHSKGKYYLILWYYKQYFRTMEDWVF